MSKLNNKPNIVLITADQWRGDCLGIYKNEHPVMTPHLNQLAAEGVNFSQAYADCPVCMPQRVTMMTGKVASRFGLPHNFHRRSPIDAANSLPGILTREEGYQTKTIGKMHFYPDRARFGFEHITLHPNDYVNWLEKTEYAGMYRGHGLGGNEVYPAVSAVPERYTHTHWIIDQGIDFLSQKDPENPFFLWMVFEAPHSPFDPPEPYDRMYDNITISKPVEPDWDVKKLPYLNKRSVSHKYQQLTDEMIIESKKRYYGQISHIDYQLGRFLGELKTKGLYDDTIIIFTADHGEHLGDYGVFAKTTYLKGSVDVPLIFRIPEKYLESQCQFEIGSPVLTADIFPTLMDILDQEVVSEVDGKSLLETIYQGNSEERIVCGEYGEEDGTAFATDGRFKYIYYGMGGLEQLFNIADDPNNLKDLSDEIKYKEIKEELKQELVAYLRKYDRPKIIGTNLVVVSGEFDMQKETKKNPCAWRGPMRHNQGYYG